jgi:hypothetical protein
MQEKVYQLGFEPGRGLAVDPDEPRMIDPSRYDDLWASARTVEEFHADIEKLAGE